MLGPLGRVTLPSRPPLRAIQGYNLHQGIYHFPRHLGALQGADYDPRPYYDQKHPAWYAANYFGIFFQNEKGVYIGVLGGVIVDAHQAGFFGIFTSTRRFDLPVLRPSSASLPFNSHSLSRHLRQLVLFINP